MRKFLIHAAGFSMLVLSFYAISSLAYGNLINPDEYILEFPVKGDLIRQTSSPKTVIIGGSNVAFGINSIVLSDSLAEPVINVGLHAGLGMRFILDSYLELFNRGDKLVVMPEYSHFFGGADGESKTIGGLLCMRQSYTPNLNFNQVRNVLVGCPEYVMAGCYNTFKESISRNDRKVFKYKKSGFNAYGDEISHYSLPIAHSVPMEASVISGNFDEDYFNHFVGQINYLKGKGVDVILLPPAVYAGTYELNKSKIHYLANRLEKEDMRFSASPASFSYPRDLMYNTVYHLNYEGVVVNTKNVVSAIK